MVDRKKTTQEKSIRSSDPYSSKIIKAGALIGDTKTLLSHWDVAISVDENVNRAQLDNIFGKASRSRVEDILAIFRQRYLTEESVTRALVTLVGGKFPTDALDRLLYFHSARADKLLYDAVTEILVPRQAQGLVDISRGVNSNGVKFYLAEHPEEERLFNTGQQDVAYRHFLDWLGGALSDEIGVLFNPNDPANRLYPRQNTLDEVLDLLNGGGIKAEETELREQWPLIWSQDETIGWVYQYFTPKELRDQARKESQAPRNSYELAFRNQFFTPRYVVEFLTDNTLGRIWYEMRKGETKLKDQCRYMVRRPSEIFLKEGEQPPDDASKGRDDLSQEELLKLPVHIPHRPKKDPRELKILDPACGSGHFLLYCFDLLLTIYEEAYTDPDLGLSLKKDYPTLDALKRDVPRLILAHNLHGIDIDLRASQIAALALWLRCQRTYQDMGFKKDRPKITRSNFVCAEPMPGEEQILKEFVGQLEPKVLGQVVEVVFDKMKLAGEAGSLLKIEEEIRDAIREAKRQYAMGGISIQRTLFDQPTEPVVKVFSVKDITDAQFFEGAEALVIEALRSYAEKAQNGQRLQRRLFTEDAVRGFAFVDLCQNRYDVVLMNPPFGESSKPAKELIEKQYPRTKNDVYAAFVEEGLNRLDRGGMIGAITSRTGFFLSSFQKWREDILLCEAIPHVFADLGYGVLDTAMVETAAYCLTKTSTDVAATFLRLVHAIDKATALALALKAIRSPDNTDDVFLVKRTSFGKVPGSPFVYWVTNRVRQLFTALPPFLSNDRTVKQGLATADDFQFIRCWWEVAPQQVLDGATGPNWRENLSSFQQWCRERTFQGKRWVPIAKGGGSSPFFTELRLVVNWQNDGEEIRTRINPETNKPFSNVWQLKGTTRDFFYRMGVTWPRRPHMRGAFSIIPSGCAFSENAPTLFCSGEDELAMCALLNSDPYIGLLHLLMSRGTLGGQTLVYDVGYVASVPLPVLKSQDIDALSSIARTVWQQMWLASAKDETSRSFRACLQMTQDRFGKAGAECSLPEDSCEHISRIAYAAYAVTEADRTCISGTLAHVSSESESNSSSSDGDASESDLPEQGRRMEVSAGLSYCVGCTFGRWDIRFTTGEMVLPEPPDPFDALPVCTPGMLQRSDNQPLETTPPNYPVQIEWNGLLVDDADGINDIVKGVQNALQAIWNEQVDGIEYETCEILGVKELRDYFRKPGKGGFWDDHISRYSKSRRKAPIYWLLQSSKKNYAIWLYYHRLDKDLLFKALVNYVEPKIRLEASLLESLRSQKAVAGESGKEAKRLAKDVERQEEFLSELRDFEDKLRRAANLHLEPDLNDGVVLNIAPLWELVPWKEAKKYWDELMQGQYEWSSIGKQLREKGLVK